MQAPYRSLRRMRQSSFTSLHLLFLANLRSLGGGRKLRCCRCASSSSSRAFARSEERGGCGVAAVRPPLPRELAFARRGSRELSVEPGFLTRACLIYHPQKHLSTLFFKFFRVFFLYPYLVGILSEIQYLGSPAAAGAPGGKKEMLRCRSGSAADPGKLSCRTSPSASSDTCRSSRCARSHCNRGECSHPCPARTADSGDPAGCWHRSIPSTAD